MMKERLKETIFGLIVLFIFILLVYTLYVRIFKPELTNKLVDTITEYISYNVLSFIFAIFFINISRSKLKKLFEAKTAEEYGGRYMFAADTLQAAVWVAISIICVIGIFIF